MLFATAIWGFNFVATRVVLEVFSAEQMAFARSALTLAILLPWWKPLERISWQLMTAAFAIGTLSFYLLYLAISITQGLTTIAVITQLLPALSAILALFFYHEQISTRKWLGILLATIGAVYLAGTMNSSLSVLALVLTVLAVLFYAVGSVIIGKSKSVGIWRMLAWMSALSLPPLGLLATLTGTLYPDPNLLHVHHWLAFLFVVVFSGLLGQAVLLGLYRRYPVADVVPWILFVPLFTGLSSILVYGESLSSSLFLGGCIILVGVWVQHSENNSKPREPAPL